MMGTKRAPGARLFAVTTLTVSAVLVTSTASTATPEGAEGAAQGEDQPYIVVLRESAGSPGAVAREHADRYDTHVSHVYSHALDGYAAELSAVEVAELRADPDVAYVAPDIVLETHAQVVSTGIQRIGADDDPHLDIDGTDDARIDVDVAVIDSGVAVHPDLTVVSRADCMTGTCTVGSGDDDSNHGTQVAGIIGAIDNAEGVVGVAPGARLHSVKVCNASQGCPNSAVVAGVDYVTARAATIEVANMSLGHPGTNTVLAQAIARSVDAGVVYAVSAGNSHQDAAGVSPANHPDVITVSAMTDSDGAPGGTGGDLSCDPTNDDEGQDDTLADTSNFGTVIDVTAPGGCIRTTTKGGGLWTFGGTSAASPHAAGAAAILASGDNDPTTRAQVLVIRQTIIDTGTANWNDTSGDGVKEPLLDVGNATRFRPGAGGTTLPTIVYTHDFETAADAWTTNAKGTDTATSGRWHRANPAATSTLGVSLQQDTTTSGSIDLVTGGAAGTNADANDLDGGTSTIRSGLITLPTSGDLTLSAKWYLAHLSNATAADYFRISVIPAGGTPQPVFQQPGGAYNRAGAWATTTADLTPFAGLTIRVIIEAADTSTASLIEAGIDDLRITQWT